DRVAVGGDQEIIVFDAALSPTLRLRPAEAIFALAFTADDAHLAAGLDGTIRVHDALTGAVERDLAGHRGPVRALLASPDRRPLASAADDGAVRLWDPSTGASLRTMHMPGKGAAAHLAFDEKGERLAAASEDGAVALWAVASGDLLARVTARGGA